MGEPEVVITRLVGQAPVYADGTVNGHVFAFHARWDGWAFSIALDPDVDVQGMSSSAGGVYREGDYGPPGGYAASYMPDEDARSIIHACAREFVAQHPAPPIPDPALTHLPAFTGRWLGVTQQLATPRHVWTIEQQGRFLTIYPGWESSATLGSPILLGKINPAAGTLEIWASGATYTASIYPPDSFVVHHWVPQPPAPFDPNRYWLVFESPTAPQVRYDVVFVRDASPSDGA